MKGVCILHHYYTQWIVVYIFVYYGNIIMPF